MKTINIMSGITVNRNFKNEKDRFVQFIDDVEGVRIENKPSPHNKKRKWLYAYVNPFDVEKVEGYLRRKGLKMEQHMNDMWWLQVKK